jgi:hypothetical protein
VYTREQMLSYHCPRWEEWPGIDLYMDQVIGLLEENVAIFYPAGPAKIVTPMMINNYVKQKIIMPSKNKRYQREHLACLYVVFLLKSVMGLPDISDSMAVMRQLPSMQAAYDLFCAEIEAALALAFGEEHRPMREDPAGIEVIRTISQAFAYTLLTRFYIAEGKTNRLN